MGFITQSQRIDAMRINDRAVFGTLNNAFCTMQVSLINRAGTGSSAAVLTVQRSNDGVSWVGLPTALTILPGAMSGKIDIDGHRYIGLVVSTIDSGGGVTVSTVEAVGFFTGFSASAVAATLNIDRATSGVTVFNSIPALGEPV